MHNSVIKSPPGVLVWLVMCAGMSTYACLCTRSCAPAPPLLSSLQNRRHVFYLPSGDQRAHSPAPSCAKPGPGGSREKAIQSRAMSRRLILTKSCRMTSAQKERPPDGTLAPPEDIKMRLENAPILPFLPGDAVSPGQQSLFTSSVLSNLPSDPLGLAPITPVNLCCHRDLVAQGPSC